MTREALARQWPALALVVMMLLAASVIGRNATALDTSIMIAIFSLFALSAGMSYGQAGIPSMATGAFAAIGAYCTGIASVRLGVTPLAGLVLSAGVPALVGYPLARAVTRLSPLPLAIATFVLSGVLQIALNGSGDWTGGYVGLSGVPPVPFASTPLAMHFLSWILVAAVLALYANVLASRFGRAVGTARHDPLRATADGVDVGRLLASFFALSAAVAGIGGWLYAHYISYISPDSLTPNTSISVLLMAVVGGMRTVLGPVLGAALLMILSDHLPSSEAQGMIFGATLVAVLILAPQGLAGIGTRALRVLWPSVVR